MRWSPQATRLAFSSVCLSFLAGCSFLGGSNGGSSLTIVGKVIYPKGNPVPYAKVATDPPSQNATTDSSGVFIIDQGLELGRYTISAQKKEDKGSILYSVTYGKPDTVEIRLTEIGIEWNSKVIDLNANDAPDHSIGEGNIQTMP
jgi:hypothetical protein